MAAQNTPHVHGARQMTIPAPCLGRRTEAHYKSRASGTPSYRRLEGRPNDNPLGAEDAVRIRYHKNVVMTDNVLLVPLVVFRSHRESLSTTPFDLLIKSSLHGLISQDGKIIICHPHFLLRKIQNLRQQKEL
jgi:hypothetical protein